MLKLFASLFCIYLSSGLYGQSIELTDSSGTLAAGDTIYLEISIEDYGIIVPVDVKNASSSSLDVNVTRYEVDVISHTSSFFCWGSCTGVTVAGDAPVITPGGHVSIGAGQTIEGGGNGFALHYDPNFQSGTSLFKAKFFDINNVGDSSEIYISITSVDYAGIQMNSYDKMTVYPTVTSGKLQIDGELEKLSLIDHLGRYVSELKIGPNDITNVPAGIYFVKSTNGMTRVMKL